MSLLIKDKLMKKILFGIFQMTENGVKTEMDQEEEDNLLHSDEYKFLVEYGISKKVAGELENIYTTGNPNLLC